MKLITTPNLPQRRVLVAAASESAPEVLASLKREGIEAISIQALKTLPEPVAAHSDLQLLHLGGSQILLAREAFSLSPAFTKIGLHAEYLCNTLGREYPNDISLNFLILNNCCFGMASEMPLQLHKHCVSTGLRIISTKQGYARCSVAVVSPHAAITADRQLYALLTATGMDVLLINPGDILLPGYDTGFIGGCCGLIGPNRLAFSGSLDCYSQGAAVQVFLSKHGVQPVYLTAGKLLDIGGILPLATEDA